LDRKTRKTGKEKVVPTKTSEEETEEEFAKHYFKEKIKGFQDFANIAWKAFQEISADDKKPARQRAFLRAIRETYRIFSDIYTMLDVLMTDSFARDKQLSEIEKQLKSLGKTVKKPEYKHIQGLLKICEKMEQETRDRPIDSLMYR
jgi:hypothetical protein